MTKIRRLNSADAGFAEDFTALIDRAGGREAEVAPRVAEIIAAVRAEGDVALLRHTRELDGLDAAAAADLEIPREALEEALMAIPGRQRDALKAAAARLIDYAECQKTDSWEFEDGDGNTLGQTVRPLARVGVYAPGGKAAYPSTVLMNAIPAKVAGVDEIVMVSPTPGGERNDLVLAAAALAGVDRVFTIGGAQAVAALAYGTETVPGVDKIVGPGNAYVAAAKRQVFGQVGIDMIAGPSEVLIIADGTGDPEWAALDLFAQAEHDEDARAILVSPDGDYLDAVAAAVDRLIDAQPRAAIIRAALAKQGALIKVRDIDEATDLSNRIAPEHLELAVAQPKVLLDAIRHAGAVFLGHHSPEAFGDYCAGPNHVLPTGRTARFSSPLGVYDFQKRLSLIHATPGGAARLASIAAELARGEGLEAHAQSAEARAAGGARDS
ncbi:histidinol dehydrogenase [Salinisphaera sp. PC39]|uniref:histidinol dehydrogenase n=1 Tax=Salinisphaera sp. PC39 TaxID=1304156 RepID=UPI0033410FEB